MDCTVHCSRLYGPLQRTIQSAAGDCSNPPKTILTGLGVNDYINRLRIEKSVYLLTNTNLNINEISYEVGFTYPRYFSTSFKQIKGMTPTQFKEEKKKNNADSK